MKYFMNTSWLFGEQVLRMFVGLFVGIWVARYLGPEQFGILNYAQSFVGLFAAISTLGLDSIVVRELVKNSSNQNELIGTAFWLKLIGGGVVLIVLAIALTFTSNDGITKMLVFIVAGATVFQSFNVIDFYFQAKVLSKYVVYANIISLALSTTLKIIFICFEAPLVAFAWTVVFDNVVLASGFIYFFYLHEKNSFYNWKFNKQRAKELLSESYPLIISFFTISISLKIDQVILKEMLNAKALGIYVASLRIIELFYFIPVFLSQSFFPSIVLSETKDIYQLKIKALSSFLVYTALLLILFLLISKDFLITKLFGEAYAYSKQILLFHSFAIIFVFFASLRKKLLLAEGKTKFIMYYSSTTALITILSSYTFINVYGLVGAPIAYLFTWATTVLIVPIFFGRFNSEVVLFINSFNINNLGRLYFNLLR